MREREGEVDGADAGGARGDSAAYHRLLTAITPVLRATAQRGLTAPASQPTKARISCRKFCSPCT